MTTTAFTPALAPTILVSDAELLREALAATISGRPLPEALRHHAPPATAPATAREWIARMVGEGLAAGS